MCVVTFFSEIKKKIKKIRETDVYFKSDGSPGTRNMDFEFWKHHGEIGFKQVEHCFSSFLCQICGIFDDFSKWRALKAL